MAKQIYFPESKKVDFYYLLDDISVNKIRDSYNLMNESEYRAFATFSDQIEHFEELGDICQLIAIINYPPKRFTKHYFKQEINKALEKRIDEIEFPWRENYMEWDKEIWRGHVLKCIEKGVRLRPMLEIGVDSEEYIEKCIEFFKEIGLYTLVTSTGLTEKVTTIKTWKEYEFLFPNIFEIKIGGVKDIVEAAKYIKSNADLIATTQILNAKE
jgi:deoxyribose-phosphate aldolase